MATLVEIDVEIDDEAIQFELPLTGEVQADMHSRMDRVVSVAKATAPVLTRAYQKSIHRLEEDDDGRHVHVDARTTTPSTSSTAPLSGTVTATQSTAPLHALARPRRRWRRSLMKETRWPTATP
jgi:hypothetical protein